MLGRGSSCLHGQGAGRSARHQGNVAWTLAVAAARQLASSTAHGRMAAMELKLEPYLSDPKA